MRDDMKPEAVPPDDTVLRRLKKSAFDALRAEGKEVVELRTGLSPLSERILEVARMWIENADGDRQIERHVITLAVAAWNASLKPRGTRGKDFDEVLESLGARGLVRVLSGGAIEMMMAYKETLFPDDPRFVIRWELVEQKDDISLNVISGLRGTRREDGEIDVR
jgi:hypothetical protein